MSSFVNWFLITANFGSKILYWQTINEFIKFLYQTRSIAIFLYFQSLGIFSSIVGNWVQFLFKLWTVNMTKKFPCEVSVENLEKIGEIFKVDWPKHVVIHQTIKMFLNRFENFPDLKEKLTIFALSESWDKDGSVFITVTSLCCPRNVSKFWNFSSIATKLKPRCFLIHSTILSATS